jgi:uncharacterized membrane protein (UPF0127 family)
VVAVLLSLPAGTQADEEAVTTQSLRIESRSGVFHLRVEIADTPAQRARGLMERASLASDAGMLFLYDRPQPGNAGFWMYKTRIPLDIAFLDAAGRIQAIRTMAPCLSETGFDCPSHRPRVPYVAALEVNGGYLSARGIRPGDRVVYGKKREAE